MARTNRNNRLDLNDKKKPVIKNLCYQTAVYVRLSVEDNGTCSDSIENQIYLLKKYVMSKEELELVSVRKDNGYTGTNFERPEFQKMMEDIRHGKINCIVVKDLSRFGRNYMEMGTYLEQVFPYLGVRFISVNDNYDSINADANDALVLAIKNIYHHVYAKDISHKICTLFDMKKKKGLFLGRFAPYGYKKSLENRYHLEIEEETAPVIRNIFNWRISGMGTSAIAKRLNDLKIPSQSRRLYEKGLLKGTNKEAKALWSAGSVAGILENPNYYGCIVERKEDTAYYKGQGIRKLPKEEWNYIEGMHEGIIDKQMFEKVQNLIRKSTGEADDET